MTLTEWAYALLGVLVGIIFVLDGWRSPPDSAESLRQSPKLRGLLFVLGAGIIPVIQTLAYVTGFAPKTAPHTRRTLPIEGSLAGWAISKPPIVYEVDASERRSTEIPFHPTGQPTWYKTVAAVAVRPLARGAAAEPSLVLCIDSTRGRILDPLDFNRRMIFALSLLLGNAAISMGVDGRALETWLGIDRPEGEGAPTDDPS